MEKLKFFTLPKVGYTAGIYGCSNEYFHLTVFENDKIVLHKTLAGLYGAEDRVKRELEEKGYKYLYTNTVWDKLRQKEIPKQLVSSEIELIELVKNL